MPAIPEVLALADAYYAKPENGVGGSLHIVLDDRNVRDDDVEFCRQWAVDHHDPDGVRLAELLLLMSEPQRLSIADGAAPPL